MNREREENKKNLFSKVMAFFITPDEDEKEEYGYGNETSQTSSIASSLYESPRQPLVEEINNHQYDQRRYSDVVREENRSTMIQQDLGNGAKLYSNTGKETYRYDLDFQLPVDFNARDLQDTMLEVTERLKMRSDVIVDMGLLDDENALIVESFLIGACSTINYSVHLVRESVLLLSPEENSVSDVVVIRRVTQPSTRKPFDEESGGYEYTNDYGTR